MIMSFGVFDNFSRSGRLPDIYESYGLIRHLAVGHKVSLTTEPDAADGRSPGSKPSELTPEEHMEVSR
jgi:hypothetical protein